MSRYFILFILIVFFKPIFSQTVIWSENFTPYADGTQNTIKWTTSAGNCDLDGLPGTVGNNFWGVRTTLGDKEFCCEDIEGLTCCTSGSGGQGQSDNVWLSEDININGYSSISISLNFRVEGNMECGVCGSGRDQLVTQYSIDSGPWTSFVSVCGISNGQSQIPCIDVGTGTTLKIRILLGNQADDEEWYFDDVLVTDAICSVVLPIELLSFEGYHQSDVDLNILEWTTASENNNKEFEVQSSYDGQNWIVVGSIEGAGNSTTLLSYQFSHFSDSKITYYRLKQVDYDGKWEFSNIISVSKNIDDEDRVVKIRYCNILGEEILQEPESGIYIKVIEYNWKTEYNKIWKN